MKLQTILRCLPLVIGMFICAGCGGGTDFTNPVSGSGGGTSGGGTGGTSSTPVSTVGTFYTGQYANTVNLLLKGSTGYVFSTNSNGGFTYPAFHGTDPCIRDTYVDAAVQAAFAIDEYVYSGTPQNSTTVQQVVTSMVQNLQYAQALCSNSPTIGSGSNCSTLGVWPCGTTISFRTRQHRTV